MVVTRNPRKVTCSSHKSQRNYDQEQYWNNRYTAKLKGKTIDEDDDHTDEWYFSYSEISDVLKSHLKQYHRQSPVLDIGCGLSKIFDELSNSNFIGPFIGVDYSPIVIKQCKQTNRNKNVQYITLNMMQKQKPVLPINSFGLIIDKATTDGILNDESHLSNISILYERVSNLLSSSGVFILITIRTVDDKDWFEDCLIPSLIRGSQNKNTKFTIHFHQCITYSDGTENGPNIFVIVKHECKSYELRSSMNQVKQDLSQLVTVKCY